MYVTCSFILMKINSFSYERFCLSTQFEKEASSNSEGKSVFKWLISLVLIPVSVAWRMLVHCRITPNIKFASTYLYTCDWVKIGSVRVKCYNTTYNVKCHNTMFPATARSNPDCSNRKETQKSNNRLFT